MPKVIGRTVLLMALILFGNAVWAVAYVDPSIPGGLYQLLVLGLGLALAGIHYLVRKLMHILGFGAGRHEGQSGLRVGDTDTGTHNSGS